MSGKSKRINTGITGLDDVLDGGFPANRLYLVQGDPGAGKTTLALQFLLYGVENGDVEAESGGIDRGSTFTVRLPLSAESMSVAPDRCDAKNAGARRVLVVEDSEDTRELMQDLLEEWGHEVSVAADGIQGVVQALATEPEVIIADIGLPKLDGFELARRIRAVLGDDVYLIAMTGYGQPDDQRRAAEAGFDRHCTKPVHPNTLGQLLAGSPARGPRGTTGARRGSSGRDARNR